MSITSLEDATQATTMEVVDVLEVPHPSGTKKIELLLGDLTQIPRQHAVDILVVSAFPNDYLPTETSLIGALHRRGVSVAKLAEQPDADLTRDFSCWLSRRIQIGSNALNFKRILCFEPRRKGRPPEVVGDIFQALAPFVFAKPHIRSVAMPIVASGDQGHSISEMLPVLLDAAFHWLHQGFPVRTIKLVVYREAVLEEARALFARQAAKLRKIDEGRFAPNLGRSKISSARLRRSRHIVPPRNILVVPRTPGETAKYDYDVFISYSRKNELAAQYLYECLDQAKLRVFIDKLEMTAGAAWQQKIFDALESCNITAVLYSPSFLQSKICKEEFNIAWIRQRDREQEVLFPLLLEETALPSYMKSLNYVDCRENDKPKISAAAAHLVVRLRANPERT